MIDETDGLHGTDNVATLFPDKPSAAGLPPQPEMIKELEELTLEAASGKYVGLLLLAFDSRGRHKVVISGKIPFAYSVTAIEQLKFGILARDYANTMLPK